VACAGSRFLTAASTIADMKCPLSQGDIRHCASELFSTAGSAQRDGGGENPGEMRRGGTFNLLPLCLPWAEDTRRATKGLSRLAWRSAPRVGPLTRQPRPGCLSGSAAAGAPGRPGTVAHLSGLAGGPRRHLAGGICKRWRWAAQGLQRTQGLTERPKMELPAAAWVRAPSTAELCCRTEEVLADSEATIAETRRLLEVCRQTWYVWHAVHEECPLVEL
jgi:hypothetical protein